MIEAGVTKEKKILLIDRSEKNQNDRTWCFWEQSTGYFEPIVYRSWNHAWFHSPQFSKQLTLAPYRYKMVRGIDFYQHCFSLISRQSNIETLYGEVSACIVTNGNLQVSLNGQQHSFQAEYIFNSIYRPKVPVASGTVNWLQHFKGWVIETGAPSFNNSLATLMDFRVPQTHGCSFVYVLPLSERKALVEYTLFSEKVLPAGEYDSGLKQYIRDQLKLQDYSIAEEEFGVIPMTNARFPFYENGMYHIGTAGGQTKGSSGYTFQFIQKQSAWLLNELKAKTLRPRESAAIYSKRFDFYDGVLLQVLANQWAAGSTVFADLFEKNSVARIFSFLDNESTLINDLGIIKSLPIGPFLKGAFRELVRH